MEKYKNYKLIEVTVPDTWETYIIASPEDKDGEKFESFSWHADEGKDVILTSREKATRELKEKIDEYWKEKERNRDYEGTMEVTIPFKESASGEDELKEKLKERLTKMLYYQVVDIGKWQIKDLGPTKMQK